MAFSRPLSNLHKHISSTTTTTVMTAFRHHFRRNVFTPSGPDYEQFSAKHEYNGYLTRGYPGPHLTLHTEDAFVFRLDVPGIRDADRCCHYDGSKISFTAQELKPHRFGLGYCEPRYYEAEVEVDPLIYRPDLFTAKVKNGLLSIVIPKILVGPGSPWRGWIRLDFGWSRINLDAEGKTDILVQGEDYYGNCCYQSVYNYYGNCCSLSVTTICAFNRPLQSSLTEFSSLSPDACVLFADEYTPGKLSIRKPFATKSYNKPVNFPNNINLLDFNVHELGRFHKLSYPIHRSSQLCKIAV